MQSHYVSDECERVHRLIDKGHKIFLDDDFALLLNRLEAFFDKFVDMTNKIVMQISLDLIKNYKDQRDKFDILESNDVVIQLDHYKLNLSKSKPLSKSDIKIIFENGESNAKACCNDKCLIF